MSFRPQVTHRNMNMMYTGYSLVSFFKQSHSCLYLCHEWYESSRPS